jgi:hypothetical protein
MISDWIIIVTHPQIKNIDCGKVEEKIYDQSDCGSG